MPMPTQYVEDYFVYQIDFSNLAPGGTSTGNINVQADSDFKWIKATYHANETNVSQQQSTRVIPLVTVQITDSGSGRQLFNNPVPIENVFGTGLLPFILPVYRIFKARSNIAVTLINFSAGSTYNIRLSFIGTKIFKLGS